MSQQSISTYGDPGVIQAHSTNIPGTLVMRDNSGSVALGPSSIAGLAEAGPKTAAPTNVTAVYTALPADVVILADGSGGAFTVNLPAAAASTGRILTIVRTGATGTITVDANGAETINGAATYSLSSQYAVARLHCNGTTWFLI